MQQYSGYVFRGFLDPINDYRKGKEEKEKGGKKTLLNKLQSCVDIFKWWWEITNSPQIHLLPEKAEDCFYHEPLIEFLKQMAVYPSMIKQLGHFDVDIQFGD